MNVAFLAAAAAPLLALGLAVAGCSSTTVIYETADAGRSADSGAKDAAAAATGDACSAYLACLKSAEGSSAAYNAAAMAYGPGGACATSTSTMQACESACESATMLLGGMCGAHDGGHATDGAPSATKDAARLPEASMLGLPDAPDDDDASSGATCSAIGSACSATSDCCLGECDSGSHVCECTGGTTACGASCVDLTSDPANCGACGKSCNGTSGSALTCGPVDGMAGSYCGGFPFSAFTAASCNSVCAQQGFVCNPDNMVAAYASPATDEYVMSACTDVPPATYEGGALVQVSCACYEP